VWRIADRTSTLLRGHFGPVFGVALAPGSDVAVTAGPITVGLWSTQTGRLYTSLHGPTSTLTAVALSPDGATVVAASRDGTVRSYHCEICGGTDSLVGAAAQRLASLS
jgi:WD40 repeat protein